MEPYDAKSALDELKEDAVLPHPVRLRDMILRTQLDAVRALEMNREFQSYLSHYGETQKVALEILEKLAASEPRKRRSRDRAGARCARGQPRRRERGAFPFA